MEEPVSAVAAPAAQVPSSAPSAGDSKAPMKPSARMSRARTLSIVSLVFAVLTVIGCTYLCVDAGTQFGVLYDATGGTIVDSMDSQAILADLSSQTGDVSDVTTALFLALFASMFFIAAVVNLIPLAASIAVIRAARRPNTKRATYVFAAIGAGCALIVGNLICAILLAVAALNVHRDFVDTVGVSVAYKEGKRLGFIRVLQVYYVFHLVASTIAFIFVAKADYSSVFSGLFWVGFVKMLMEAVFLWFTWTRRQHGREVIMGMTVAYLLLYVGVTFGTGSELLSFGLVKTVIASVIIFCYFAFAKRPRTIFTEPFRTETRESELAEEEKLWNPRSWRFWRNLLLYFCVFSVVGHWMEWCVCWVIRIAVENGITLLGTYDPNSGIWHNMLNPFFVYGAALVLIGLILYPIRNIIYRKVKNKWAALGLLVVCVAIIVCALELGMGLALNSEINPETGKHVLWDYSTMPFNFMGQICLLNSSFFTTIATIFTTVVYPNLEKAVAKVPNDIMNIVTVVILVFFVLVVFMYVVPAPVTPIGVV